MMNKTNTYYKNNMDGFIENTINCDMSTQYNFFTKYLVNAKTILDLGFGSGRDSLYFKNQGYEVYAIDPVKEFCNHAKALGLDNIYNVSAQQMDFDNLFDGIWACASLLHIPSNELVKAFNNCYKSLKNGGIMYCSFKYGNFEGERNGRYFVDLTEDSFNNIITKTSFNIVETFITKDVRPSREESWLNIVLRK